MSTKIFLPNQKPKDDKNNNESELDTQASSSQSSNNSSSHLNQEEEYYFQKPLNTGSKIESTPGSSMGNDLIFGVEDQSKEKSLMVEDNFYKIPAPTVIKVGSKVGTGYNNSTNFNQKEKSDTALLGSDSVQPSPNYLGRKGSDTKWSNKVTNLKGRFGGWKKTGQTLAMLSLVIGIIAIIALSAVAAVAIDLWNNTDDPSQFLATAPEKSVVYASDGQTKIFEFYGEQKREEIPLKIEAKGADGKVILDTNGKPKMVDNIPKAMQLAIIAIEDREFYKNEQGIPWKNIAGAVRDCLLSAGDECRGGSGLSQQLIKNVTGRKDATLDRKVKELFAAIKLNEKMNHEDVLSLYLNRVPFGRNAYGVQEASRLYFGRDVNAKDAEGNFILSKPEACFLASMVQSPTYFVNGVNSLPSLEEAKEYDYDTLPASWQKLEFRKNECLNKMYEDELQGSGEPKFIPTETELKQVQETKSVLVTKDKIEEAKKQGYIAFVKNTIDDPFPHFREFVTQELLKFMPNGREEELQTGGYEIVTTLDVTMQRNIEKVLQESEKQITTVGANNASAVVLDGPTGQIKVMVGSLGYNRDDINGKVNIATSAQQPGSSIKPYVYASAFANGFNPGTVLMDVATSFSGNYTPKNFDGNFSGAVTMRSALQNSLNIPAVKSLYLSPRDATADSGFSNNKGEEELTLNGFFNFTEKAGVKFPCVEMGDGKNKCQDPDLAKKAYRDRCYLSSALGGCEVTLLSHSTGINTLLQQGDLHTATPFVSIKQKIKDSQGKEKIEDVYEKKKDVVYPSKKAQIDPLIARQVTHVMTDYDARLSKYWGRFKSSLEMGGGWRIAAKTGTSNGQSTVAKGVYGCASDKGCVRLGPKDFWTVGGSPYYTVNMWVGRTDDRVMNSDASAGASTASIWKKVMESVHSDKAKTPVKAFSKEGLVSVKINDAGYINEGGRTELLTPNQKAILTRAGASTSQPDFNLLKKNTTNIFDLRSTILTRRIKINKLDGKLFVEGKTLPENGEEKYCSLYISEFPSNPKWQTPVENYYGKSEKTCGQLQASDQDQVAEKNLKPTIETNLQKSTQNVAKIIVQSQIGGSDPTREIISIKIKVDGETVATAEKTTALEFDTSSITGAGPHTVTIWAFDNLNPNEPTELIFNNVTFASSTSSSGSTTTPPPDTATPPPAQGTNSNLEPEDITSLSCKGPVVAGQSTDCTVNINPAKSLAAGSKIQIGSGNVSSACTIAKATATCPIVVPVSSGSYSLIILSEGKNVVTNFELKVP